MYTIQWQCDMMPRERLLYHGAESLSNQELLAILLRTGTKQENVMVLSQRILEDLDSLASFRQLSLQELQKIVGIGQVKAIQIKAMLELAKRIQAAEVEQDLQIGSSYQIGKQMMLELGDKRQEHLVALYLDTQNRILEKKTVFIGTVRKAQAEPREILHYACKNMATSIILVHNHPSGEVKPSQSDQTFTEKIKRSCEDLGIVLLDHLIVSRRGYYSFREQNHFD